jgi:hypothetical protein
MHFHAHAYNVLVHGRKQWVLLPPSKTVYSQEHIKSWLHSHPNTPTSGSDVNGAGDSAGAEDGPSEQLHCTQEAGDVLYVPDGYGHGVLNLAESVGYAIEFTPDSAPEDGDGGGGPKQELPDHERLRIAAAASKHKLDSKLEEMCTRRRLLRLDYMTVNNVVNDVARCSGFNSVFYMRGG